MLSWIPNITDSYRPGAGHHTEEVASAVEQGQQRLRPGGNTTRPRLVVPVLDVVVEVVATVEVVALVVAYWRRSAPRDVSGED